MFIIVFVFFLKMYNAKNNHKEWDNLILIRSYKLITYYLLSSLDIDCQPFCDMCVIHSLAYTFQTFNLISKYIIMI